MLKPGPQATEGNNVAWDAVYRTGSSNAFQQATGLS